MPPGLPCARTLTATPLHPPPRPQAGAWTSWSPRRTQRCEPVGRPALAALSARRCRWARPPGTSTGPLCSRTTPTGWSPRMASTTPCCCVVPSRTTLARSPSPPATPWPPLGSPCWVSGSGLLPQVGAAVWCSSPRGCRGFSVAPFLGGSGHTVSLVLKPRIPCSLRRLGRGAQWLTGLGDGLPDAHSSPQYQTPSRQAGHPRADGEPPLTSPRSLQASRTPPRTPWWWREAAAP